MRVVHRRHRPLSSWWATARNALDQVALCLCFIGFGVWSAVVVIRTPGFSGLHVIFVIFNAEFLVVGVMGLLGITLRRHLIATQFIVAAAMAMLGLVLLVLETSPFSLLSFGFALQAVIFARHLLALERARSRVAAVIAEDRTQHEAPPPGGEGASIRP